MVYCHRDLDYKTIILLKQKISNALDGYYKLFVFSVFERPSFSFGSGNFSRRNQKGSRVLELEI